ITRRFMALFDDVLLEALDEGDDLASLGGGDAELGQGVAGMTEEDVPVALADAHAAVGEGHVPSAVVHGPAGARAEVVDEELLLTLDPIGSAMGPEPAQLRIVLQPGQQIIGHGRDRIVATQAIVERLDAVAHGVLLPLRGLAFLTRAPHESSDVS